MLDLKLKKEQIGVLLALLAVVLVAAAVYVYQTNRVSEPFKEGNDGSDDGSDDDSDSEGFETFTSY